MVIPSPVHSAASAMGVPSLPTASRASGAAAFGGVDHAWPALLALTQASRDLMALAICGLARDSAVQQAQAFANRDAAAALLLAMRSPGHDQHARQTDELQCWYADAHGAADVASQAVTAFQQLTACASAVPASTCVPPAPGAGSSAHGSADASAFQVLDCHTRWRVVHGRKVHVDIGDMVSPPITPRCRRNVADTSGTGALDTPTKHQPLNAHGAHGAFAFGAIAALRDTPPKQRPAVGHPDTEEVCGRLPRPPEVTGIGDIDSSPCTPRCHSSIADDDGSVTSITHIMHPPPGVQVVLEAHACGASDLRGSPLHSHLVDCLGSEKVCGRLPRPPDTRAGAPVGTVAKEEANADEFSNDVDLVGTAVGEAADAILPPHPPSVAASVAIVGTQGGSVIPVDTQGICPPPQDGAAQSTSLRMLEPDTHPPNVTTIDLGTRTEVVTNLTDLPPMSPPHVSLKAEEVCGRLPRPPETPPSCDGQTASLTSSSHLPPPHVGTLGIGPPHQDSVAAQAASLPSLGPGANISHIAIQGLGPPPLGGATKAASLHKLEPDPHLSQVTIPNIGLLGTVTHAASMFQAPVDLDGGGDATRVIRDSVDRPRVSQPHEHARADSCPPGVGALPPAAAAAPSPPQPIALWRAPMPQAHASRLRKSASESALVGRVEEIGAQLKLSTNKNLGSCAPARPCCQNQELSGDRNGANEVDPGCLHSRSCANELGPDGLRTCSGASGDVPDLTRPCHATVVTPGYAHCCASDSGPDSGACVIDPPVAAASDRKCLQGHPLATSAVPYDGGHCDECSTPLSEGATLLRCGICQYDVCQSCRHREVSIESHLTDVCIATASPEDRPQHARDAFICPCCLLDDGSKFALGCRPDLDTGIPCWCSKCRTCWSPELATRFPDTFDPTVLVGTSRQSRYLVCLGVRSRADLPPGIEGDDPDTGTQVPPSSAKGGHCRRQRRVRRR